MYAKVRSLARDVLSEDLGSLKVCSPTTPTDSHLQQPYDRPLEAMQGTSQMECSPTHASDFGLRTMEFVGSWPRGGLAQWKEEAKLAQGEATTRQLQLVARVAVT